MSPPSPAEEGWHFYFSISTLTTHNTGGKQWEEPEEGRTQLVIQFPQLTQCPDT